MRILMCECGKQPYMAIIGQELEDMQDIVGGYIQAISPYADPEVVLVCNEEGKLMGLPANRAIYDESGLLPLDMVAGDFFLCGSDGEEFVDFPEHLVDKYTNLLRI